MEAGRHCPRRPTRRAADWRRSCERLVGPFRRGDPPEPQPATGFYTDTTVCIGCKACEVACKQWNQLPADGFDWTGNSYDNTGELSATSWRHVKFIEQFPGDEAEHARSPLRGAARRLPTVGQRRPLADDERRLQALRRRPCQHACPTGAIIYNEFENVYIQPDICNGCAYCIAACPFGVITRSDFDGHAHKCTLCYDRQRDGLVPACAKACPTAVDPVRPDRRAARAGAAARRGAAPARRRGRLSLRRRAHRDLFRAEFVLPAGRSPVDVRPAGKALQPVAAHDGRLRPRRSSAAWSRSPPSSSSVPSGSLRCRCRSTPSTDDRPRLCGPAGDQGARTGTGSSPGTCCSTT